MSLKDIHVELILAIKYNLSVLLESSVVQKVGLDLEEVAAWFQALGICNLLIYGDTDKYYENLIRSGHTRRYFLKRSQRENNLNDYQLAISRWESFFDCVAAGDFTLARELVKLSSDRWVKDGEYEDDFCYVLFLNNFVLEKQKRDVLKQILKRWERWLEGQQSVRYKLCQTLLKSDGLAFESEFQNLLEDRTIIIENEKKSALSADITFKPRSYIFIEGLALLRLAKVTGFRLENNYQYCPELALTKPGLPFPEDIFDEIEALRLST